MTNNNSNLKITFINVGYGEAILLEHTADKESGVFRILIDGGSREECDYKGFENRTRCVDYLHEMSISHLDILINTHIHEDHVGGLVEVAKQIDIDEFWAVFPAPEDWDIALPNDTKPDNVFVMALGDAKKTKDYLEEKNVPIKTIFAGFKAELKPGFSVSILAPKGGESERFINELGLVYTLSDAEELAGRLKAYDVAMNNMSAVLMFEFNEKKILLVGDTNISGYGNIPEFCEDRLKADVLKLGHHGQKDSVTMEILNKIDPKIAVICADSKRRYNSAHPDTIKLLREFKDICGHDFECLFSDEFNVEPYFENKKASKAITLELT
ncbi:MAG: MBL fold metallo-hydrolase [Lachnospiraceae bacterium]|jgi:competence protein ComEC|nr:MBL fold metallo-hydrolase [Lachnospiraceae bacterium]